ncbi:peptidase S1 [Billgrantia saliphila]|uniref:peptidase S1 n=1 Tax=Billgrantia saliphila TaxID=1848458 RepID=UPI000CE3EF76|nr:peptidase S1 [Halomonas saliphila]
MKDSLLSPRGSARIGAIVLGATLAFSALTAQAQQPDWSGDPSYGSVHLEAGFTPDPWTQSLQAGGSTQVSAKLGPNCTGYIMASAPDVDLHYTAGSMPLYFAVQSASDTTLIINAPDGRWYCNDDFNSLDPVVMFPNPASGMYNVWVGVHGSSQMQSATLKITELNPTQ